MNVMPEEGIERMDQQLLVRFDISGSGYTYELENNVRSELETEFNVVSRGGKTPAAGPELLIRVALEFFGGPFGEIIAGAIIDSIADRVLGAILDAVGKRFKSSSPYCSEVKISATYDLTICIIPDGEADVSSVDIGGIVDKVNAFVQNEAEQGNHVSSVVLPCEICNNDDMSPHLEPGRGSFDLWYVTYRDGERLYQANYDAANGLFLG